MWSAQTPKHQQLQVIKRQPMWLLLRRLAKKTLLDNAGFAKEIAQIVVDTYPEAHTKDYISVTFTYGYRIGIASSKHSFTHGFNPAELKAVSTK